MRSSTCARLARRWVLGIGIWYGVRGGHGVCDMSEARLWTWACDVEYGCLWAQVIDSSSNATTHSIRDIEHLAM